MANSKSCRTNFKVSMNTLSVVIPAHNEEATIGKFVSDLATILNRLIECKRIAQYEIIILDDGSSDNTSSILQRLESLPRTRLLFNKTASGIHGAFLKLYNEAKMEWVLLVPGDAQWPAEEIEKLIDFHFKSEILLPTITKRKFKSGYSKLRIIVSFVFGNFAGFFLRTSESPDPGSIKILPRRIADFGYISKSVTIEIERMIIAENTFGKLQEFEISVVPRIYGNSSSITWKTLKPILLDCCKMLYVYKVLSKIPILTSEERRNGQ